MGGRLKSPGLGGVKPSALVTDVATELTVSPVSAAVLLLVCGRWSESGPGHVDPEHCTEQDPDRHEVRRAQPAIQSPAERSIDERSEEHTSELQSLMRNSYAVFCLKNKTKNKYKTP